MILIVIWTNITDATSFCTLSTMMKTPVKSNRLLRERDWYDTYSYNAASQITQCMGYMWKNKCKVTPRLKLKFQPRPGCCFSVFDSNRLCPSAPPTFLTPFNLNKNTNTLISSQKTFFYYTVNDYTLEIFCFAADHNTDFHTVVNLFMPPDDLKWIYSFSLVPDSRFKIWNARAWVLICLLG